MSRILAYLVHQRPTTIKMGTRRPPTLEPLAEDSAQELPAPTRPLGTEAAPATRRGR